MKGFFLLFLLLFSSSLAQQDTALSSVNRQIQLSILCYHDFTAEKTPTPMRMRTEDFRAQMQALADGGVTVISMEEFLAWRAGQIDLPDRSVLITFDDGWRSVYEEAFPILAEFGYPFTLFLYTDFIDIGGLSLSREEIVAMQNAGATIGCHSTSHPYPQTVLTQINRQNPEAFHRFLKKEMIQSREILQDTFHEDVLTYAYPGGFYNNEIRDFGLQEAGFTELFTVNPARANWNDPRGEVNRFVIHGDDISTFHASTTFHGVPLAGAPEHEGITLLPAANSTISERLPLIEANLSSLGEINPESLILRITGLGEVPAIYDPQSGLVRYAIRSPLRCDQVEIFLSWKRFGSDERDAPLSWSFQINRTARYEPFLLKEEPRLAAEIELIPTIEPAAISEAEAE